MQRGFETMANYTAEEIKVFLDYEREEENAAEMYSELTAEAWMNAKSLGMDRPSLDALPKADDFQVAVPDGYDIFCIYFEDHFLLDDGLTLTNYPEFVLKKMAEITHEQAAEHYARKAEAIAAAELAAIERDPDWDEYEPPF